MGKKKTGEFNLTAEVVKLLKTDKTITAKSAESKLKAAFPKVKINASSLANILSTSRKKLGIKPKRKRRSGKKVVRRTPSAVASAVKTDFVLLESARDFVSKAGNTDKALAAIRQLQKLQIK